MPLSANIKKILIPRFDTLGDIVLLEPFLKALGEFFKEAQLTLLVQKRYEQLAPLFPNHINWQDVDINPYSYSINSLDVKDILSRLENEHWDLILFTKYEWTWLDHLVAATLKGVQRVAIGKTKEFPKELNLHFMQLGITSYFPYDKLVPVEERTPEREKYEILLKYLMGKNGRLPNPKLTVPYSIKKHSRKIIKSLDLDRKKYCVCFPGGIENIGIKVWPADKFAEIINWLKFKYNIYTLLVGHENERKIVEEVNGLVKKSGYNPSTWFGKDGEIPLLAGILEDANFYFGNDTGPMHISAALGIPVVALFGGGHWPRFIPKGLECHVVVRLMPCFYCEWKCFFGDAPCIKDLPLSLVQESLEIIIKKKRKKGAFIHEAEPYPEIANRLFQKAWKTFKELEADRAARLGVINTLSERLQESEADRTARLGQVKELTKILREVEADRAARLEVIERQAKEFGEKLREIEADRAARLEVINELTRLLKESETDRATRLEVINCLNQELEVGRAAHLAEIDHLSKHLQESEADRAARLDQINRLSQLLQESEADRQEQLEAISCQMKESEADRAKRLEVINYLNQELGADRAARLAEINHLSKHLQESEADRSARLDQINSLSQLLQESEADRQERLEAISCQLKESEADRARRLEVINRLNRELEDGRAAHLETINNLNRQLKESEADRARRLEVINYLNQELGADRAARLAEINHLSKHLQESEADRSARLDQINSLSQLLQESEADRQERLEMINRLSRQLKESELNRSERVKDIQRLNQHLEEIKISLKETLHQFKMAQSWIQDIRNNQLYRSLRKFGVLKRMEEKASNILLPK